MQKGATGLTKGIAPCPPDGRFHALGTLLACIIQSGVPKRLFTSHIADLNDKAGKVAAS
jgi:hypothetical protein